MLHGDGKMLPNIVLSCYFLWLGIVIRHRVKQTYSDPDDNQNLNLQRDALKEIGCAFNAMAQKVEPESPFQRRPSLLYLDNGPVAKIRVFQNVMQALDIECAGWGVFKHRLLHPNAILASSHIRASQEGNGLAL
jgi:hypothetical protein